jgi:hypothetical protein
MSANGLGVIEAQLSQKNDDSAVQWLGVQLQPRRQSLAGRAAAAIWGRLSACASFKDGLK